MNAAAPRKIRTNKLFKNPTLLNLKLRMMEEPTKNHQKTKVMKKSNDSFVTQILKIVKRSNLVIFVKNADCVTRLRDKFLLYDVTSKVYPSFEKVVFLPSGTIKVTFKNEVDLMVTETRLPKQKKES